MGDSELRTDLDDPPMATPQNRTRCMGAVFARVMSGKVYQRRCNRIAVKGRLFCWQHQANNRKAVSDNVSNTV